MRFFNERFLATSKSNSPIYQSLEKISADANLCGALEDHGRNVGKAHGAKNTVVQLSKVFISLLLSDAEQELAVVREEMNQAFDELLRLPLPGDIREGLICDAEQELIEAFFCDVFVGYVLRGSSPRQISFGFGDFSARGMLAGLIDAVGEIGKLFEDYLAKNSVSAEEDLAIRSRYVEFGRETCAFLSTFKAVPPTALNASRRPGQGFHGKLARVESLVYRYQGEVTRLRREAELLQKLSEVTK